MTTTTFPMGTRVPVTSSNVRSFTYREDRTLDIEFGSGTYRYADVDLATAEGLYTANSKGQYVTQHIRGRFSFAKL